MEQSLAELTRSLNMLAQVAAAGSEACAQQAASAGKQQQMQQTSGALRPSPSPEPNVPLHQKPLAATATQIPASKSAAAHPSAPAQQYARFRSNTEVPRKQQQQPQPQYQTLNSALLESHNNRPASAAAAPRGTGSVAGSTAPSLAATLGRIHRQLDATCLPQGMNPKDPAAWMNPKHTILQTQAKLNKLSRLDRNNKSQPFLSSSPPRAPSMASSAHTGPGKRGSAPTQQQGLLQQGFQQQQLQQQRQAAQQQYVPHKAGLAAGGQGLLAGGGGFELRPPVGAVNNVHANVQGGAQQRSGSVGGGQQGPGQSSVPLTEAALRQLPVAHKPRGYRAVPSEAGTHADWWRRGVANRAGSTMGSVMSYPRTAVTDRNSVTPSELAAWESRMSSLEATIQEEKKRRQKFEAELRHLEQLAISRGAITTGGIAVAKGPTAGQLQQAAAAAGAAAQRRVQA